MGDGIREAGERYNGAMELNGAVAVVTGASRGIGRAIAEALAARGAKLVLNARSADALRDVVPGAEAVAGDVGDEATAGALVAAAVRRFGRLDLLVNNAGVGHRSTLEATGPDVFDQVVRTNLRGPYLLMRAAIPAMRNGGGGTIVNIASLAAVNPVPERAAYAATKWGLLGLSRSVLQEVRKDGIRVIVIEPGSTLTEFGHDPKKLANAEKCLKPEDVAATVVAALALPDRACLSEIEIRPTDPP